MMNTKSVVLRYGLWGAGISVGLALVNWLVIARVGYTISEVFGYLSFLLALMVVPLAIRYHHRAHQDQISLRRGFLLGLGISFVIAAFTGLYSALFFVFQKEEFMSWYRASMSEEEWISSQAEMAEMGAYVMTPWFQGLLMFFTVLLMGVVVSFLSAFLLRRS